MSGRHRRTHRARNTTTHSSHQDGTQQMACSGPAVSCSKKNMARVHIFRFAIARSESVHHVETARFNHYPLQENLGSHAKQKFAFCAHHGVRNVLYNLRHAACSKHLAMLRSHQRKRETFYRNSKQNNNIPQLFGITFRGVSRTTLEPRGMHISDDRTSPHVLPHVCGS